MKKLKNNLNVIILCIFEIAVGVLLLISPKGFAQAIIIAAGVILTILGLISAVKYFKTDIAEAAMGQYLTVGLLAMLAGIFLIIKTEWIIGTFAILTIIFGILVLITGLSKLQLTCDLLRRKSKKWFLALISAAISIICAVIIINHPLAMDAIIWIFTGVVLIAEALLDVITVIFAKKESSQTETETDTETNAETETETNAETKTEE